MPHHEAMLYDKADGGKVKCKLCERRCLIPEGKWGFCGVRRNENGELKSIVYGKACSLNVDPITKKPLAHFHPGSLVLSISTIGCNFRCRFCDNWVISQKREVIGKDYMPEEVVEAAKENDCQGISYTYTEPTVFFEYALDTAKLAHKEGLFNTFVTNGYMTPEAIKEIAPFLDAATVDFKGGGDPKFYWELMSVPSVDPIYNALLEMKRCGIHIEVTNLVVTKVGDSMKRVKKLAAWISENLGPDTPFHLLRFHPDYKLTYLPSTPLSTLERAYEVSKEAGLRYVYLGNVPGHRWENTYCPNCGELLIKRFSFGIIKWRLNKEKKCPNCGEEIPIIGDFHPAGYAFPYSLI